MTPIYILHGWARDVNNEQKWQPLLKILQAAGLDVIFLPIPGLDAKLAEPWTLDHYVSWLSQKIGERQAILLGHSFGGQIACRFTAKFPHKVSRLILIDSAGLKDHRLKMRLKRQIFYLAAKIGKTVTDNATLKKLLYKLAHENDYFSASPVMKRTLQLVTTDEIRSDLPRILAKTLMLWGESDTVTPLFMGKTFKDEIKNSRLVVVKNAKHAPQFTNSDEVARIIKEFIYE